MGRTDALKDKILKLGSKQKLGALLKYADSQEDDVRMTVAMAMGMCPPLTFTQSTAKNTLKSLLSLTPTLT